MKINAPTETEIVQVLEFIGKKEGLQLPPGFAGRIALQSNRSMRRAILSFETCRVQQYPFTSNQAIPPMDWEEYVSEIASSIFKEQSPKRLFEVREKLYELLINCIPPEIVWKRLLYELLKKLDSELNMRSLIGLHIMNIDYVSDRKQYFTLKLLWPRASSLRHLAEVCGTDDNI